MHHGVHKRFAHRGRRHGRQIAAAYPPDRHAQTRIPFHKHDGLLDRGHRIVGEFGPVHEIGPIGAGETTGLDIRVGELQQPIPAEEEQSTHGRDHATLVTAG